MKRFSYSANIAVLIFGISSFGNNVHALSCYEKSPNYVNLADEYFNLESPRYLSDKDKEMLNTLYSKIEGKWEGELQEIECKGPDSNPRMEYDNYELNAEISPTSNAGLTIRAEKYNVTQKIRKGTTVTLLNNTPTFEFNFVTDDHLIFSDRYRRRNVNGSSRLNEYIHEIKINGNTLEIKISLYVNGVHVSEEIWTLTGK